MSADTWTGRLIDGRYAVESIIGQGGMGVVLKARHKFTGAQVALKMLQPDLQMNEEAQRRFQTEAQTATAIGHPGIVTVTDAGITPEGEPYLAMELLTGRTLRQAMYPTIPPQIARRILLELLDALGAAHARGIVHRDLKPENVFLVGPQSTVKLLDFGIAKVVQTGRTAAGMMLGTLSYMAPEQLSDASSVDARADLWAVGVMVYEMLSGKLPFRGTQLTELMMALATKEPDPIRVYLAHHATPAMEAFFTRALAKDRDRRFATAQDMAMGVSAMMIEGTAPPGVISTLTGVGSAQRSNVMTAADSDPSIPSRQIAAASAAGSAAQPIVHAHAVSAPPVVQMTPSTPFVPHVPPPGTPPPMAPPHHPSTPPMAPNHPSARPQPAWPAPPAQRSNMTLWIVLGSVGAVLILVIAFVAMRDGGGGITDCASGCEALSHCDPNFKISQCTSECSANPIIEKCVVSSEGSCEAVVKCAMEAGKALDSDPDRFQGP